MESMSNTLKKDRRKFISLFIYRDYNYSSTILAGELALIGVEVANSLIQATRPDTSGFTDFVAQITPLAKSRVDGA